MLALTINNFAPRYLKLELYNVGLIRYAVSLIFPLFLSLYFLLARAHTRLWCFLLDLTLRRSWPILGTEDVQTRPATVPVEADFHLPNNVDWPNQNIICDPTLIISASTQKVLPVLNPCSFLHLVSTETDRLTVALLVERVT